MNAKFQRQLSNGSWADETDDDRINTFLDSVLVRETWYAPRINREPMTTREQVLAYLATGKTIQHDDDWYAKIRDGACWEKRPVIMVEETHWNGTRYDERCGGCGRVTDVCNDCGRCENCH